MWPWKNPVLDELQLLQRKINSLDSKLEDLKGRNERLQETLEQVVVTLTEVVNEAADGQLGQVKEAVLRALSERWAEAQHPDKA